MDASTTACGSVYVFHEKLEKEKLQVRSRNRQRRTLRYLLISKFTEEENEIGYYSGVQEGSERGTLSRFILSRAA